MDLFSPVFAHKVLKKTPSNEDTLVKLRKQIFLCQVARMAKIYDMQLANRICPFVPWYC